MNFVLTDNECQKIGVFTLYYTLLILTNNNSSTVILLGNNAHVQSLIYTTEKLEERVALF